MNRYFRGPVRLNLIVAVIALGACGGSDAQGPAPAGPPATLAVVSGGTQQGQAGEPLPAALTVKAADAQGNPVPKVTVTFTVTGGDGTLSARVDTTDASGTASTTWTMGSSLGDVRAEARVAGLLAPAVFTATVKAGPPASIKTASGVIGSSATGFITTDSVAVMVTDRFNNPIEGATVSFAVTAGGGTVSHASRAAGVDGVAKTAWTMGGPGAQTLKASIGSLSADVTATSVACPERAIAVGEVVTLDPATAACLISNTGGAQKYVVAVSNSNTAPTSFAGFRVRGAGGGAVSNTTASARPVAARGMGLSAAQAEERAQSEAAQRVHARLMRANRELLQRFGPQVRAQARKQTSQFKVRPPAPSVGDTMRIKIPGLDDLCSLAQAKVITGRVVYSGTKAVVWEDKNSPLAGQLDERFRAVGEEFDNVMYPILANNFGNPLAMDAQTDDNGRIFMVFSPVVNDLAGGNLAGFVTSGDFIPPAQCPASNFGEYFYARAPTVLNETDPFGINTPGDWSRRTRTVIVHEVKHVTSFAEKFASPITLPNNYFTRDQWLEESSAMIAEELWARTVFNYAQKGNVNYDKSIYCEVRPASDPAKCTPSKPTSMIDHFFLLYDYLLAPETLSAVGPTAEGDFSFYGSGWAFLRWVLDTYAPSESAFLTAMNLDMTNPGTDNIQQRTGKSFADLMSEFALAIALDEYSGFTPASAALSFPSWNLKDMYMRLNQDFGPRGLFTSPAPLKVRPVGLGKFTADVGAVRGGGFAIFELTGTTTNKQLLEFRGQSGQGFPAEMRVKLVRVQ